MFRIYSISGQRKACDERLRNVEAIYFIRINNMFVLILRCLNGLKLGVCVRVFVCLCVRFWELLVNIVLKQSSLLCTWIFTTFFCVWLGEHFFVFPAPWGLGWRGLRTCRLVWFELSRVPQFSLIDGHLCITKKSRHRDSCFIKIELVCKY